MASLPYADAFIPSVKYCIMWVTKSRCKLICSMGVKFIKSVLVKGMISKAAMKGMGESINQFIPILEDELQKSSKPASQGSSDTLNRVGTLRRQAAIKRASTTKVHASGKDNQSWLDHPVLSALSSAYETGRDLVLEVPLYVGAAVSAFVLLWFFVWLLRSPAQPASTAPASLNNTVVSRAVYLRDLREGILEPSNYKPVYVNTERYDNNFFSLASHTIAHPFSCFFSAIASSSFWLPQTVLRMTLITISGTTHGITAWLLTSC